MAERATILTVDDDPDIRRILKLLLERSYTVLSAANGAEALTVLDQHPGVDLILLDIAMPDMDGYETCSRIRSVSNAPVLFLTAKSAESSLLDAFQSGGDDFLTKPFSNDELLVKIGSLLRRYTQYKGKPQEAIVIDQLEVDLSARTVTMAGDPVSLTDTEYSILEYMLQHRGETLTAEDIYTGVWKEKYLSTASNTIMVHILNLRKKLESKSASSKIIKTVWGKGYRID